MIRKLGRGLKPRRIAAVAAALALAAAVSGCVVYPAGPGIYHPYYHHHDWR